MTSFVDLYIKRFTTGCTVYTASALCMNCLFLFCFCYDIGHQSDCELELRLFKSEEVLRNFDTSFRPNNQIYLS